MLDQINFNQHFYLIDHVDKCHAKLLAGTVANCDLTFSNQYICSSTVYRGVWNKSAWILFNWMNQVFLCNKTSRIFTTFGHILAYNSKSTRKYILGSDNIKRVTYGSATLHLRTIYVLLFHSKTTILYTYFELVIFYIIHFISCLFSFIRNLARFWKMIYCSHLVQNEAIYICKVFYESWHDVELDYCIGHCQTESYKKQKSWQKLYFRTFVFV